MEIASTLPTSSILPISKSAGQAIDPADLAGQNFDAVLVATDHDAVDYGALNIEFREVS